MTEQEGYRYLEHTSDAFIEVWAPTVERAFAEAGTAFFEVMLHTDRIEPKATVEIVVAGHDEKELLYNWLEALLLKFEIEGKALGRFDVQPISYLGGGVHLNVTAQGEPYDPSRHGRRVAVKGITYHRMTIQKKRGRVLLRFLLDL